MINNKRKKTEKSKAIAHTTINGRNRIKSVMGIFQSCFVLKTSNALWGNWVKLMTVQIQLS